MLSRTTVRHLGLGAGPVAAGLTYAALAGSDLGADGRVTASLAAWMAIWWLTEAIPLAATALLPLVVLPLSGARSLEDTAPPYAHPLIFLFLGGFLLALAMERWGLHRRIALHTLRRFGSDRRRTVGGFMAVAAFMSMWTSNTATAIVMLPIALSVIERIGGEAEREGAGRDPSFAPSLLLGIAYAASIGGMGTIIGTAPNLFLASFIRDNLDVEIGFADWMRIGVPLVVVLVPLTWLLLTRVLYDVEAAPLPGGRETFDRALTEIGPIRRPEVMVLVVFVLTAAGWLARPSLQEMAVAGTKPFAGLSDAGIAVAAAVLLFVLPVGRGSGEQLLDWEAAARVPWDILLLFGGGLSLAAALRDTGVAEFLGAQVAGLAVLPDVLVVLLVTAMVVFLTELTSNTATTAALVPVLAGVAPAVGLHPYALIFPAALSASCAFMLPVATPPNAIIFGSGRVSIAQMARTGFWLNLLAIAVLSLYTIYVALPLLGIR
ncbi:MAG: SLC13 family permease [Myxococcota bacterium]